MTFFTAFTKKGVTENPIAKAIPMTVKHARRLRRSRRVVSFA